MTDKQEPVAYLVEGWHDGKLIAHIPHLSLDQAKATAAVFSQHYTTTVTRPLYAAPPAQPADYGECDECGTPYSFDPTDGGTICVRCMKEKLAAQPAPAQRLSDARIAEIASTPCAVVGSYVHTFARAIEAAILAKE